MINMLTMSIVDLDPTLRHGASPTVGEVDGEYVVDRQQGVLIWQLPSIDSSNPSGSLEFNCEGEDTENFFPVTVQFESERLICDVDVRCPGHECAWHFQFVIFALFFFWLKELILTLSPLFIK